MPTQTNGQGPHGYLISHRLDAGGTDAIMKLYNIGTHQELLRRYDIYKQMWYQQNRHLDPGVRSSRLIGWGELMSMRPLPRAMRWWCAASQAPWATWLGPRIRDQRCSCARHRPPAHRALRAGEYSRTRDYLSAVVKLDRVVTSAGRIVPTAGELYVTPSIPGSCGR